MQREPIENVDDAESRTRRGFNRGTMAFTIATDNCPAGKFAINGIADESPIRVANHVIRQPFLSLNKRTEPCWQGVQVIGWLEIDLQNWTVTGQSRVETIDGRRIQQSPVPI